LGLKGYVVVVVVIVVVVVVVVIVVDQILQLYQRIYANN